MPALLTTWSLFYWLVAVYNAPHTTRCWALHFDNNNYLIYKVLSSIGIFPCNQYDFGAHQLVSNLHKCMHSRRNDGTASPQWTLLRFITSYMTSYNVELNLWLNKQICTMKPVSIKRANTHQPLFLPVFFYLCSASAWGLQIVVLGPNHTWCVYVCFLSSLLCSSLSNNTRGIVVAAV